MYRVQIVLPGTTGIPEDHFVNTIYTSFTGAPSSDAGRVEVANLMASCLSGAYANVAAGQTESLGKFISGFVDRQAVHIKVYTMEDPKPREPTELPFSMPTAVVGTQDLPEEVALCLTIHGGNPVTPRRRGRIYTGPFNSYALDSEQGPGPSRPKTSVMQVVRSFGEELNNLMDSAGLGWCIKSEVPSLNYVQVVGGWCDDAWDTQRRRGVDPTTRWRFPASA